MSTLSDLVPQRVQRSAASLEKTPAELVEIVLNDLPLEHVIQLSAFGPHLESCISNHLQWGFLFNNDEGRPRLRLILQLCYQYPHLLFHTSARQFHYRDEMKRPPQLFMRAKTLAKRYALNRNHPDLRGRSAPLQLVSDMKDALATQLASHLDPFDQLRTLLSYIPKSDERGLLGIKRSSHAFASYIQGSPLLINELKDRFGRRLQVKLDHVAHFCKSVTQAQRALNQLQHDQLLRCATMLGNHPTRLKQPLAPQTPRRNILHIQFRIRHTAKAVLKKNNFVSHSRSWSAFSKRHACLIPYDWCLRLFLRVLDTSDDSLEKEIRPSLTKALAWLTTPYPNQAAAPSKHNKRTNVNFLNAKGDPERESTVRNAHFIADDCTLDLWDAYSPGELDGLEAFVECVAYMEESFPDLAIATELDTSLGCNPS